MKNSRKYIFTGIMSIIPITITYWIIQYLFIFFSVPGKKLINLFYIWENLSNPYLIALITIFEYTAGFILTITFLYILGQIISNVLGNKLYRYFENLINKIPFVSKVYSTIKSITETLSKENNRAFQKVVLIQYPRHGLWTYAMVTGECINKDNVEYYNLFVPTTPNPTSGYLIIIKKTDVIDTDLSVDDGLSVIISGGMVSPEKINIK